MQRMIAAGVLILSVFLATESAAQVSIFPASPKPYETVRIQVPASPPTSEVVDRTATKVLINGRKITVSLVVGRSADLPEPFPKLDLPLGSFPGGNAFDVEVVVQDINGQFLRSLGTASFSIPARASGEPLWNLTDLWWKPEESGWGFNMIQHGSGVIFATWFVYGPDNKPIWYVVPGGQWSDTGMVFRGPIYQTSGPTFCFQGDLVCTDFDPSKVARTLVGDAMISVNGTDFDNAIITMTINGKTLARSVRRQSF
jgi:hypothetical protein